MTARFVIALMVGGIILSSCDSGVVPDGYGDWIKPTITVQFVKDGTSTAGKNQTVLNVRLTVMTVGGTDYSPDPVVVDNALDSEVRFEVEVPPDSTFSFKVSFDDGGRLVGEGGVVQQVTAETATVNIPVLPADQGPLIGILPSVVQTSRIAAGDTLVIRYYGTDEPVVGIAARFMVTGPDPVPIRFDGADLVEEEGNVTSLGWQFATAVSGVTDIGTITVPLSETADFCVEIAEDDARIVDQEGAITIIGATGACIEVTP